MTILGVETSSAVCSVGLANDEGMVGEQSLVDSHIHSEKLLTLVQNLCERQKIELGQLDGIAISLGPGSFTGLRIGLSTVKGLCFSLEKPLLAVPAFESVAVAAFMLNAHIARVVLCVDAKQGEYYYNAYERRRGTIQEVTPVRIGSLSDVLGLLKENTAVLTDRMDEVKKNFHEAGVIENILPYCRGDVVAHIGVKKLKEGAVSAPEDLEPLYLKDFIIRKHAQ